MIFSKLLESVLNVIHVRITSKNKEIIFSKKNWIFYTFQLIFYTF